MTSSRAHQAPFYARGLAEIIAVSENAPGAHRDVPRTGRRTRIAISNFESRIFAKMIKGAPGVGSLLLNTKASQEAACSRAPAAIVPSQEPALDAGVSRFAENGSHLAKMDAAESYARQVDGPGSSGNAKNGSHLAATGATEDLAGDDPPGANENGQVGRWDFEKGKARTALSARKCHQRCMAICPVKTAFLRTKLCS